MRLVYTATGKEVKVGDNVSRDGLTYKVDHFRPPSHGSSSGKVSVSDPEAGGFGREYYVRFIGAEWIEREDQPAPTREG